MYYYHTNDEIDEIGEGIIRKYNYQAFIQGDPTDIEGFIADTDTSVATNLTADTICVKVAGPIDVYFNFETKTIRIVAVS